MPPRTQPSPAFAPASSKPPWAMMPAALLLLALGILGNRAEAQTSEADAGGDGLAALVKNIELVLRNDLTYVEPPAFAALREEIVRRDKERLETAFAQHVGRFVGPGFPELPVTGKAVALLRILKGIPEIGVDNFADPEIVLTEASHDRIDGLLSRLRRQARAELADLKTPGTYAVVEGLVLTRISGPQTGEFYATSSPCTRGLILQVLGSPEGTAPPPHSGEIPQAFMDQPLGSISFEDANRLADRLSDAADVTLALPTAGQARALNINSLAIWTRTPWAEETDNDDAMVHYGVELRTVADMGSVLHDQSLFPHVSFARHSRLGLAVVASVPDVRRHWMEHVRQKVADGDAAPPQ